MAPVARGLASERSLRIVNCRAAGAAWRFWLGMEDSNPHIQIQSLLSYP